MNKVTEVTAKAKNVGISQKKGQIIAQIIRGMNVEDALGYLLYINKHAAKHFYKVVRSAFFNAVNNYDLNKNDLYIKNVRVDKASSLTRVIFKGKGRIAYFRRPFSHITVELSVVTESKTQINSDVSNVNAQNTNLDVSEQSPKVSSQDNAISNSVELEEKNKSQSEQSVKFTKKASPKKSKKSELPDNK